MAGGIPLSCASSVEIPCMALASRGIGTTGLTSHVHDFGSLPGISKTIAAETMRHSSGLTPVVSKSNPTIGPAAHEVLLVDSLDFLAMICMVLHESHLVGLLEHPGWSS